jgi:multimeric flavodoxin WrbA
MDPIKICGIVGSPNKRGNVDLLVSQVLLGAESQGAETQKLSLNDVRIGPCQDCPVDPLPAYCHFDDDMARIYAALDSCDGIVLGTPVYFDTVSAQTKLAIDRCNCLMPYVQRADGTFGFERRMHKRKKGVFIAVAGTAQEFDTILTTVKAFFDWANIELVEAIFYGHDDIELGGVRHDEGRMAQAFEVGAAVAKECAAARSQAISRRGQSGR